MDDILTYDEKALIRHTIGLDRSDIAYRNHFAASEGHADLPLLDGLVARGLMVRETAAYTPGFTYRVTAAGKTALSGPPVSYGDGKKGKYGPTWAHDVREPEW